MATKLIGSIKDTVNVITGCGSGLGKATLRWFLQRESGPILAIDRYYSENFVDSLLLKPGERDRLVVKTIDTRDYNIQGALKEFTDQHGPIDNLINVAGVAAAFALYNQNNQSYYNLNEAKLLQEFNTVGTFNMIRLTAKHMIKTQQKKSSKHDRMRCIINTSCFSTHSPTRSQSAYAASKAGLDSMTLCLARELSPFKIRCNTINVGFFDTPLIRSTEDELLQLLQQVMLAPGRVGQPDEFAHLVQRIIENPMLNGCCIKLDGGAREFQTH